MNGQFTPIPFPVKGIHSASGFGDTPFGYTPDCLNVMAYDILKNRLRGGRRPGLSKYCPTQLSTSPVQNLCKVGTAVPSTDSTVTVTDDFSSVLYGTTGVGDIGLNYARGHLVNAATTSNTYNDSFDGPNDWMAFNHIASVSWNLMAIAFYTSNNITAVLRANRTATANNGNDGLANESTWVGPYIRASDALTSGIGARLIRVGANQVQLQIFSYATTTITQLAVSATQNLDGSATLTADVSIQLFVDDTTNTVTAILTWPSAGIAPLTLTTVTATNAGNMRAGFGSFQQAVTGGSIAAWRILKSITFTKKVPATPTILATLSGTQTNPIDANRYFLPSGWASAILNTSTNAVTTQIGPATSAADPAYIAVDDTNNVVWDRGAILANTFGMVDTVAAETLFDVEMAPQTAAGATPLCVAAAFKVSEDRKNGIFVEVGFTSNTNNRDSNTSSSNVTTLTMVVNGAVVSTRTAYSGVTTAQTGYVPSLWRITYDPANFRVTVKQNGITMESFTLTAGEQVTANTLTGTRTLAVTSGPNTAAGTGYSSLRFIDVSSSVYPVDIRLLGTSNGVIQGINTAGLVPVTNNTSNLTTGQFDVYAAEAYGKVFYVDGTHTIYFDKASNTINAWTATTAGTIPSKPTLIALYRGRVVLAGVLTDPYNWFMSALGDPFNYDYSPAVTVATQAVAGNNSPAGLVGDVITALIPMKDDVLIFGGDHTIWKMTGDPADGGTIDMVSDKTGIAFGMAWAKDPDNNLYFWGQSGIYKYSVDGGQPENITRGILNNQFQNLNRQNNLVRLEWDFFLHGLVVQIVNANTGIVNTSFFYDARTNGWWPMQYPAAYGPTCMLAYDGNATNDQAFLFGCRDGYVRKMSATAENDDGIEIESRVRYPMFIAEDHASEVVMNEILPVLAATGGPVELKIYRGQSAEHCAKSVHPFVRRLLTRAGRNQSARHKVRGFAIQVELSQGAATFVKVPNPRTRIWAVEGLAVRFDPTGKPKKLANAGDVTDAG